ncbi:MAG: bifunctional nuclease family protein [Ignavibacteria bacterium]|nr:bifunctional nuclease family protein [Ignavibacteria bacterium]
MVKIEVRPIGITASPDSPNAYALILKEKQGNRSLPIIIGPFEAQSIALVLEGMATPRPLTHDLMKMILDELRTRIDQVYINDLRDGTFYARIIFEHPPLDIDARPSDAVALAVRCHVPIFVNSDVLDQAGITFSSTRLSDIDDSSKESEFFTKLEDEEEESEVFLPREPEKPKSKIEILQEKLEKAIKEENYELAAKIRDELKKITEK